MFPYNGMGTGYLTPMALIFRENLELSVHGSIPLSMAEAAETAICFRGGAHDVGEKDSPFIAFKKVGD